MTQPPDPRNMAIPAIESPFLDEMLSHASLADDVKDKVRHLATEGYVVLDVDVPDFDATARRILDDLAPRYPRSDRRVAEAWYWNEDVRALATLPALLDVLKLVYQREPIPFQTLNFDLGTEQPAHSDTLHFHCVPHHFMCGIWIALEDIHPDSGPLFVHPGSHRLPSYDMHDLGLASATEDYTRYEELIARIMVSAGYERVELCPKKGQAVIWLANLYHGGSPQRDKQRTRHSQVTHYYFDDCMYYFPMESDPFAGKLCMREVIDIGTGRFVPHRLRGTTMKLSDFAYVWSYPRPLPDWVSAGAESDEGGAMSGRSPLEALHANLEHLQRENQRKDKLIAELDAELQRIRKSAPYRLGRRLKGVLGRPRA